MRLGWRMVALIGLALALASCGSSEPTAPRRSELVGTWDATKIEYVNVANADEKVEIVGTGGSGILKLNADGTFQLIVIPYGFDPMVTSGEWHLSGTSGNQLVIVYPVAGSQATTTFDLVLAGQTLTLSNGEVDAGWDFTGDGVLDPAILNLAFVRAP